MKYLTSLLVLALLAGCASHQIASTAPAVSAASAVAQTLAPQIAPDVAIACTAAVAGLDAASACVGGGAAQTVSALQMLAHASCDRPQSQAALTANDIALVQPDGGSASWLVKLETAGVAAAKLAPIACAIARAN